MVGMDIAEKKLDKQTLTLVSKVCSSEVGFLHGRGDRGGGLDKEYFNILVFGQKTAGSRHLRIHRKTFKIGFYLFIFFFLSTTFFFCDYVQLRKRAFELARLRQETQVQKSQIQFFSGKIEDLERQVSKLKDFDKKIRIIANLEKEQATPPMVGVGGPSSSDIRERLKSERDDNGLIQQMRTDIERLQSEATSREESFSELEKLLQDKKEMLSHTPSIWPTLGWVTSAFGFRTNPFTGLTQMHEGLDISNRVGTAVVAAADGIVSDIGSDSVHGKVMVVSHGFGMMTRYSHLSKITGRVGQKVKRGDKIAEVGTTGRTTGPHLHYEIKLNGIPVNPMRYILN
jgi:murein DD-endopeptidase MepM/ murein hydrolase activator NlpD